MLIRNYGLFWKVEDVHWGYGAHMMGIRASNVRHGPVDFRRQIGVYALYADYDLIYVGQVNANQGGLLTRLKHHKDRALADRWNRFSWFGVRRVTRTGQLAQTPRGVHSTVPRVVNHIEAILIHTAEPRVNRQGGRFGEDVEQYLQYRDDQDLGPSMEQMVRAIYEKCDNGN